jgi:DNA-binding response OmpR family regulator/nitrogen-specific signal transduction histidine kinase
VVFLRDITGRKRAEEEREKLTAQLTQAQKMESIGRLAGGVAHDFNNMLTVINGYSQMLLGDLSADHPLRNDLAEIHKAGERAAGLTRQLLAFSRKQVLQPRTLDVNRVVEEMRPMLERLVGADVEVRVALHAESGTVHADPHQLEQVIMNLVVNARDAMPGGGSLLIETAHVERDESGTLSHPEAGAGRYVMLAVSDDGVGMDGETTNRIFEPFFTTKGVGKGTGLGLSMVQGIVAQSGGYINVYSEPGQGTSFKIYLPALAEAVADDWKPAAVPVLGGKETVLVVEDQAEVRKFVVEVLNSYGYRVIQAENAGEALLLRGRERGRIDLVLTDVVMPNVSGRELAERLETLQPGIKVLFMSGYTGNVMQHHGVLKEGAAFIQKPFSPEELAGKVRAVLELPAPAARILVADDEAGVRRFLRAVLEEGGYEVVEAADGKQALQEALAGRVDLVITDLVMPEQEGIETIQALRRDVPGVGIIAISGAFEGQFLKTALLLGADAGLSKPVSAGLLLARVAEVLKSRR